MGLLGKKEKIEITEIPLANLDIDPSEVTVLDEFYNHKTGKIKTYTGPVIALILMIVAAVALVFFLLNFKIIEGDVIGKEAQVGPFSIVSIEYDPADYVKPGKEIYYNGQNTFLPIAFASQYQLNVIDKVTDTKVFVPSNGLKDTTIGIADIDYVLETGVDKSDE